VLERLLHEQYESDGKPVLFGCSECDYVSLSLGSTHAHIENHRGYTRFNIQLPFTKTAPAKVDELMKRTTIRRINDAEEIQLSEVEGL
jgi:hypothetical protein